ncbi:hypothetical protein M3J09_007674 [Ascochyta lentis]
MITAVAVLIGRRPALSCSVLFYSHQLTTNRQLTNRQLTTHQPPTNRQWNIVQII